MQTKNQNSGQEEPVGKGNEVDMDREFPEMRKAMETIEIPRVDEKMKIIRQYVGMIEQRRIWAGLTSRGLRDNEEEIVLDTMAVLTVTGVAGRDVVEIGAGSGLLGIILAILCEEMRITLLESSGRKSAFLAETLGALGIQNARVVKARAEELGRSEAFDFCLTRASGRLVEMVPMAMRLLKPGGRYIAIKGKGVAAEVEEAETALDLSGALSAVIVSGGELSDLFRGRVALVVTEKAQRG
jgi:16S rRNA (guanine(527)-N(7))-methyltransferase RsmG